MQARRASDLTLVFILGFATVAGAWVGHPDRPDFPIPGPPEVQVSMSPSALAEGIPVGAFRGLYFDNADFTNLKVERIDAAIDFDWGTGSPDPSIGPDTFSVRWEGYWDFARSGSYRFTMTTDDGMRVWVDNETVLDKWFRQWPTTYVVNVTLEDGRHYVKVEFYEGPVTAVAKVSWAPPPLEIPTGAFRGSYYDDANLANFKLDRADAAIDFDWGAGSPDTSIAPDTFGVRWEGYWDFDPSGPYTFTVTTDDGIRVWIDNETLLDSWIDQPATTYVVNVSLGEGTHFLKVEYFEDAGLAVAKVSWALAVQPLLVSAKASLPAANVNQSIDFSCSASEGLPPYAYAWSFGDGDSANDSTTGHAYRTPGTWTATCTVSDAASQVRNASMSVVISPQPRVAASVDYPAATPGTSLTFAAHATGGPGTFTRYEWWFGDGKYGLGQEVIHAYAQAGQFPVQVVVTDANGGTASDSLSVSISLIEVTWSASTRWGTPGTIVFFNASAVGGAGAPYSYAWDFGDGSNGSGASVSHTYLTSGNFAPGVVVTDGIGANVFAHLPAISIGTSETLPPLGVTIRTSPAFPMVNETVFFVATGDGGSGNYTCSWDFGGPTRSTGCEVSHAWSASGRVVVEVRISDSRGNETTKSIVVDIVPPLTATLVIEPRSPVPGRAAFLTARPAGGTGGYRCTWDFGDSGAGPDCRIEHGWSSPGRYSVVLIVNDSQGHIAIARETIVVQPADEGAASSQATFVNPLEDGNVRLAAGLALLAGVVIGLWRGRRRRGRFDPDFEEDERFLERYR